MTHTKANKSKILMLVLGLTMCLVFMLGIAIASPANTARAEETDLHIPVSSITATSNYEVEKTTTVAITEELVPVTDLEKVYDDNPQEPTFGGTLVRDTDYEVSYAVKAGSTGSLTFGGIPVGAGTYVVTVTGKGAYVGSFTKEFVINKAEQTNVPVGLIANPISCREGSGTIDGVTIAMEYRKVGDADYTACTSSKITGLAAGEYQIRYAENENYLASADETVTIAISHNLGALNEETPATCTANGMKAHYYCSDCRKFFDADKNETTEAALTIPATGDHTFGTLIEEKPATCIEGGMKAHYKCTVCGKYVDADKKETTEDALKTPVSPYYGHNFGRWVEEEYATCQAPGRKGYKHCSICNKDYDASNTEITDFVIPVNPDGHELGTLIAEVPATCKDTGVKAHRDCNLCGKHCDPITRKEIADLTIPATGVHNYGAWVSNGDGTHTRTCTTGSHSETENCSGGTATCENKAVCEVCGEEYGDIPGHNYGKVTYTWTSDNKCKAERVCTHDSAHIESETVTATAEEIKAATCKEKGKMKYTATFTNTAFAAQVKEVDIDFAEHTYGDLIPEVPATTDKTGTKKHYKCSVCGKLFDESKNEVTAADLVIPMIGTHKVTVNGESNFYKEGESVTVTATAEEIKAATCKEKGKMKYTATFTNTAFAAQVKEVDIDFAEHTFGELIPEVSATADKTGTKKHFECSVCGKLFDENKNEVTAADLVIPKIGTHNVVINGESKIYKEGESVTVTAEDKEGKEFKGWKDESGKIVSTNKSYTFTVKGETTLTAVYQNKAPGGGTIDGEIAPAPDKNGLSGGQIAGIVIGSLAGVGIVGFAIFWFVVKKKSFAELISAVKVLFNKKQ